MKLTWEACKPWVQFFLNCHLYIKQLTVQVYPPFTISGQQIDFHCHNDIFLCGLSPLLYCILLVLFSKDILSSSIVLVFNYYIVKLLYVGKDQDHLKFMGWYTLTMQLLWWIRLLLLIMIQLLLYLNISTCKLSCKLLSSCFLLYIYS